jgi:hypothetical protein
MFTQFNFQDFPDTGWVDFSNDATIVGWSSFDTRGRVLIYKIVDNILYVIYRLDGTSNSTSAYFTIPVNLKREFENKQTPGVTDANPFYMAYSCSSTNNGTLNAGTLYVYKRTSLQTAKGGLYCLGTFGTTNGHSATWTASGTKRLRGQFFLPI